MSGPGPDLRRDHLFRVLELNPALYQRLDLDGVRAREALLAMSRATREAHERARGLCAQSQALCLAADRLRREWRRAR